MQTLTNKINYLTAEGYKIYEYGINCRDVLDIGEMTFKEVINDLHTKKCQLVDVYFQILPPCYPQTPSTKIRQLHHLRAIVNQYYQYEQELHHETTTEIQ